MGKRVAQIAKVPEVKQSNSNSRVRRTKRLQSIDTPVDRILYLQRTAGNQAVSRLMKSGALQAKLRIGQPGDVYEQEADRVADEVMRMPEPGVLRQVEPEEEEEEPLQTKFASELTGTLLAKTEASHNKTGMSDHLKSGLENLSGMDISSVRVHHNSSEPAQLNALAYTQGQDIHLAPGQEKHLPHEGWHAVQQMQGRVNPTVQAKGVSINNNQELEREADVMGTKALQMTRAELATISPARHESTSPNVQQLMQQGIVQRKVNCSSTLVYAKKSVIVTEKYALIGQGEIIPWSAAMHPVPPKFKKAPHDNTCEDVRRGTKVIILGHNSNWMYVHTMGNLGFISKELIKFEITPEVAAPSFIDSLKRLRTKAKAGISPRIFVGMSREAVMIKTVEANEKWNLKVARSSLDIKFKQIKDAFLILKKAENKPTDLIESDKILVEIGTKQLNDTGKYNIDPNIKKVTFKTTAGTQINIGSIEDFILFIEKVEDTYPSSSVKDIVSEIRQMWFSDMNWEILADSRGIKDTSGGFVDIETKPNPIAVMFNIPDLAPDGKKKVISSPLGDIAISHVISGIDTYLSGSPSLARAESHMRKRGTDTTDVELKHKTLTGQHGGDPTDFTTWSGDLGQGYAKYLVEKYVKSNSSANLKSFMDDKGSDSQLLADIHGYIAVKVWMNIPLEDTPSGGKKKLSNILRDLYLVNKKGISTKSYPTQIPRNYRSYFEQITKKKGSALNDYIKERSLKFGSLWYAKKAVEHRGWVGSKGWGKEAILTNSMNEFDDKHKDNDRTAATIDKLDFYVDKFIKMLNKKMQ